MTIKQAVFIFNVLLNFVFASVCAHDAGNFYMNEQGIYQPNHVFVFNKVIVLGCGNFSYELHQVITKKHDSRYFNISKELNFIDKQRNLYILCLDFHADINNIFLHPCEFIQTLNNVLLFLNDIFLSDNRVIFLLPNDSFACNKSKIMLASGNVILQNLNIFIKNIIEILSLGANFHKSLVIGYPDIYGFESKSLSELDIMLEKIKKDGSFHFFKKENYSPLSIASLVNEVLNLSIYFDNCGIYKIKSKKISKDQLSNYVNGKNCEPPYISNRLNKTSSKKQGNVKIIKREYDRFEYKISGAEA